jgi:hypothetical protein
MREVNMLKRRDEGIGKILFVDIDAPDYDPAENAGISYEQVDLSYHLSAQCEHTQHCTDWYGMIYLL